MQQVGFRFGAIYLLLHNLEALTKLVPGLGKSADGVGTWWREAAAWVGHRLLGITREIPTGVTGSSDTTSDWIRAGMFVVMAGLAAVVWTLVERRREPDARTRFWLRVGLRYVLGSAMLLYGFMKMIPPIQFTPPSFAQLTQTFGDSSPQGLLWKFMGFSPLYVAFLGFGEALAGAMLFFRRTTLVGALITTGIMANVVMLNLCYDLPVKLYSGHLLLMALWLIWPDLPRIFSALVLNRSSVPVEEILPWSANPRTRLLAVALKTVLVAGALYQSVGAQIENQTTNTERFGLTPPELRGIWAVESFELNGQPVPPLATDKSRWHTLIFGDYRVVLMRRVDGKRGGFWFVRRAGAQGAFVFERSEKNAAHTPVTITLPETGLMHLATTLDGAALSVTLRRVDEKQFPLLSRGFNWVTEVPFNR